MNVENHKQNIELVLTETKKAIWIDISIFYVK
jgi:hypothetical protein